MDSARIFTPVSSKRISKTMFPMNASTNFMMDIDTEMNNGPENRQKRKNSQDVEVR